jgi:hypothetical protein
MSERTLTDADIEALVVALATKTHHCRFAVETKQFERVWPVMVNLADNVTQVTSISKKIVVTGIVLAIVTAVGRGLYLWIADFASKLPK